jgi:hypothetical protein
MTRLQRKACGAGKGGGVCDNIDAPILLEVACACSLASLAGSTVDMSGILGTLLLALGVSVGHSTGTAKNKVSV